MRNKSGEPTPLQRAIDEQAKSAFPEPVFDSFGKPVKGIWAKKRRRTENILIEAIDKIRAIEKREGRKGAKKAKRQRRRRPRIYSSQY